MQNISTINPAIMKNMECMIVTVCTPIIDIRVGVSPKHTVLLHFVSLLALRTFG